MHLHVVAKLGVAAGLAAVVSSSANAQTATPEPRSIAACVAAQAETLGFSGIVSIAAPGGPVTYARGVLGVPGTTVIGVDTRFNLGSAGKMFTAVAVAQLIDAGKIGVDDAIGRYVDGLTREASAVTVRHLLTHTSGLGNFFSPEHLPAIRSARTVSELLPLVASDRPAFAPGTRFLYSNTGFLLLGRLVERVSGSTYDEYLQRHIFAPAGMIATGLEPGPTPVQAVGLTARPDLASGSYGLATDTLRPAAEAALRGNPAGGSYSTVVDMQRFFAGLVGARLTSAAMVERFITPQIVVAPAKDGAPEVDHGFGFAVGSIDGHRWLGHNGGAPGVNVETATFPGDQTTVIVLANRDPPVASALFRSVRATLFGPAAFATTGRCPPTAPMRAPA